MEIKDQLNNMLIFDKTPTRIISLVPSLTELLVDLGLEKYLLGITKFCVHPIHLKKEKTIVGGTKNVNFKKIEALQPDIVICNKEENTKNIVTNLQKITSVYVSDINTINDTFDILFAFAEIFNIKTISKKLVSDLKFKLDDFESFIINKSSKKAAYFIWHNPWMVTGGDTFINELLKLNKFKNVFKNNIRYPEINLLQLKKLDIDLILLSSEPYPFKEKHITEMQQYTNAKIILVDGEYFSWYGSRLLLAFNYFKTLHQ